MRNVILESPYKNGLPVNVKYARRALLDCLNRGDAPLASHLLYTQVLNDNKPADRMLGMKAGMAWLRFAAATVVYHDMGITSGMAYGIDQARRLGIPIEFRLLTLADADPMQPELFGGQE